ncbi:MAG: hypothetical protein AMXMBFR58_29980 [Phycisphaerae bacterium]
MAEPSPVTGPPGWGGAEGLPAGDRTSASRLLEAKSIFLRVQPLDAADRPAAIDAACSHDASLRDLVLKLVKADGATVGLEGIVHDTRAAIDAVLGESPGAVIGPYTLVRLIGEGGFGSVFLASQSSPVRREVALKVLKAGMDTRQVVARFEQERQALAMMDHPGIAKVFDAGVTASGRPYFVMEYCTGRPMTGYCDELRLGIDDRLELFVQVCSAIQHAHHKGIIHRDIKPDNILVDEVDGRRAVRVIDFGIAKAMQQRLTVQTLVTEQFQLVGTLEYMSPEQAAGNLDIDTRTDVYSLGVLLYELLTGFTPFDPESLRSAAYAEAQRLIRHTDPPSPSARLRTARGTVESVASRRAVDPAVLRRVLRGDLDWIVMKAIEKERSRRYDSVGSLARDVQRHLAGEPVLAAPASAAYRARKFVRRNRGPVVAAVVVALTMVGGLVGTTLGFLDARNKTREAQYESYIANMSSAVTALAADNLLSTREFLASTVPELRGWEWRYTMAATDSSRMLVDQRDGPLVGAGMNAEATVAATLSASGVLRTTDPRLGRLLSEDRLVSGPMTAGAVSVDGSRVIVASREDGVRLFDAGDVRSPRMLAPAGTAFSMARFSPSGTAAACATADGNIVVWDLRAGTQVASVRATLPHIAQIAVTDQADAVAYIPEGRGAAVMHPLGSDRAPWQVGSITTVVMRTVEFSPDGSVLATGSNVGEIYAWDVKSGELKGQAFGGRSSIEAMTFTPDGARIALGTLDAEIYLSRPGDVPELTRLTGHRREPASIGVSGTHVISASPDGTARAWELPVPGAAQTAARGGPVHSVDFSPDGEKLLYVTQDKEVVLRDLVSGAASLRINGQFFVAGFDSTGKRFITSGGDGDVKIWDSSTGRMLTDLRSSAGTGAFASISPDGSSVVAVGYFGDGGIWDARDGSKKVSLARMDGYYAARFSPDGKHILTTGTEDYACVWDARTGERLFTLNGHQQWIPDGSYSHDGSRIVTASEDRTVRIWDARDGRPIAVLRGHRSRVGGAHFSPDGTRIFSVAGDSTLRVWDADPRTPERVGRLLATFAIGAEYFLDLAVSPDGSRLAISGGDGEVRILDSLARHERLRLDWKVRPSAMKNGTP